MRVEGLVLAAGLSSRMGDNKLIKTIDGMPMIDQVLASMIPFSDRIIVVVGHRRDEVTRILKRYDQVEIVVNDDYQSGMFSSVKAGCRAIRGDRFFIIPADMPFVAPKTYKALLEMDGEVVVPSMNRHSGHPILLQSKIATEIAASDAEHLRAFLSKWEKTYVCVEDEGIFIDIDTPEDYEKYGRRDKDENIR
jgi:molybdenum cofactor cytidylyltransferase